MVKLIASDLDGTILRKGAQSVEPSTIKAIEQLVNKGMYFAPASGRQIVSLKRLFEPVSDKLVYIAENGALCEYKGEVIAKTPMDRKLALEIIEDVYEQPDCEVLISGQHTAYIKPKTEEYHYRMTKVVNYKTTLIDKFTDVDEDILKIAVCDLSGIDNSRSISLANGMAKLRLQFQEIYILILWRAALPKEKQCISFSSTLDCQKMNVWHLATIIMILICLSQ